MSVSRSSYQYMIMNLVRELPFADLSDDECESLITNPEAESYTFIDVLARQSSQEDISNDKYDICKFESLLCQLANTNNFFAISEEIPIVNYKRYTDGNKTISLFETVKDTSDITENKGYNFNTLEKVLDEYSTAATPSDMLIIPIVSLLREHYRLIAIDLCAGKASYYDSKPMLWKNLSELSTAVISTVEIYYKSTAEEIPNGNALQYVFEEAKKIGTLFQESYLYVDAVFKKYFPDLTLVAEGLGHQAVLNDKDCGVYTALYVDLLMQGKDPAVLGNVNPEHCRLHHRELLMNASMDKTYEEFRRPSRY